MKRFPFRTAAIAGIAAVLLGLSASPALAVPTPRPLAPGSAMYALDCFGTPNLQLLSVDVETAAATTIGPGSNSNSNICAWQSAWDAVTQTAYDVEAGSGTLSLGSVDLTTGVSTDIAEFTLNGAPAAVGAIAIGTDGAAYGLWNGELYSVDLATAQLAPIASVTDTDIFGFAVDPTSGQFFTINESGLISNIDVVTGALTSLEQVTLNPTYGINALQIDSNGTMWVENDGYLGNVVAELWSVDPTVPGSAILSGTVATGGNPVRPRSLLIVPGVAPVITSGSPTASMTTGSTAGFTISASGTTPMAFSISAGALPTGQTLDPTTGVVSGTATTAGSFTYTVTATNAAGNASASYTQRVAAPRALAAGSALYAVSCDLPVNLQLLTVDASTAAATTIGSGANIDNSDCAGQSAWDAVTHTAFYTTSTGAAESLVSVNLTTGDSTRIAGITLNGTPSQVDAIAIGTDGAGYALSQGQLFALDLTTAKLTPIGPVSDPRIFGFAVDPASGTFYTIDQGGLISSIDVATGTLTTIGQTAFEASENTFSLQIDSNGIMWVQDDTLKADVWSVDPADVAGSGIFSGTVAVGGSDLYMESLLIVPAFAPVITSAAPAASIVAGTAISIAVTASGTTPISFSITSGGLPTGLALDPASGVVSGTPTTAGVFTYTVTATNAAGTATATYTQLVTLAAVPAPTATPTPTASTAPSASITQSTTEIHLPVVSG
jgi:hypothetical protein